MNEELIIAMEHIISNYENPDCILDDENKCWMSIAKRMAEDLTTDYHGVDFVLQYYTKEAEKQCGKS